MSRGGRGLRGSEGRNRDSRRFLAGEARVFVGVFLLTRALVGLARYILSGVHGLCERGMIAGGGKVSWPRM